MTDKEFIEELNRINKEIQRAVLMMRVVGFDYPHIIYNPQAGMTIMIFADGEKIISKTTKDDEFDPEVGVAMCLVKRIMSRSAFKRLLKSGKWMDNATS